MTAHLPLEALNDLEKMRETLELVITQSKEIGKDKAKTADAMAMLEEATNSRSMLARDDYDARRWKDEVADSREELANSRSVITSAVDGTTTPNAVQPPRSMRRCRPIRSRRFLTPYRNRPRSCRQFQSRYPPKRITSLLKLSLPLPKSLSCPNLKVRRADKNAGRSKSRRSRRSSTSTSRLDSARGRYV